MRLARGHQGHCSAWEGRGGGGGYAVPHTPSSSYPLSSLLVHELLPLLLQPPHRPPPPPPFEGPSPQPKPPMSSRRILRTDLSGIRRAPKGMSTPVQPPFHRSGHSASEQGHVHGEPQGNNFLRRTDGMECSQIPPATIGYPPTPKAWVLPTCFGGCGVASSLVLRPHVLCRQAGPDRPEDLHEARSNRRPFGQSGLQPISQVLRSVGCLKGGGETLKAGPEILKLKSSWRRSKFLAVSLKHWKGRRSWGGRGDPGGGGGGSSSYDVRPFQSTPARHPSPLTPLLSIHDAHAIQSAQR